MASHALWSHHGTYPPRQGNEVDILIDGQAAYKLISDAFNKAKEFIYLTISYCDDDFLLTPENDKTIFDTLNSRRKTKVDVRMVVWEPALNTADTIPDKTKIPGVNDGPECIQVRWDKAKGYSGLYRSPHGHFEPVYLEFPALLGCHHQKTYMMDDGEGGVVAFVGGINPVQSYWDTPKHDVLDKRRVEKKKQNDLLKALESKPPLHDIFYKIRGPAVRDVIANFVERYNGASIPHKDFAHDVAIPSNAENIPPIPDGIELQVVRTIAPDAYPKLKDGERGIRELYLNMLATAEEGDLVYIENQYFFDHGIVSEIHEAAERGAKIIVVLTSKPDEDTTIIQQMGEKILETISSYEDIFPLVKGHQNVGLFTLGNSRPDPRVAGKVITSETYVHSKNMAVVGGEWAIMTGGSANIAFTSMWFHSEMNIVFTDIGRIKDWVAQLWSEHLMVPVDRAKELIERPDDALAFFKAEATRNKAALKRGQMTEGRVYEMGTAFPLRDLAEIDLGVSETELLKVSPILSLTEESLSPAINVSSAERAEGFIIGGDFLDDVRATIIPSENIMGFAKVLETVNNVISESNSAAAELPLPTERRISVWVNERAAPDALEPLWVNETYTLNFRVGQPVLASLLKGNDTAVVPSSDVPKGGLNTEWVISSRTVEIDPISMETSVIVATIDNAKVWTARFSLHIPDEGDSLTPQLKISPCVTTGACLDILIYVRKELYRQFSVQLRVQEKSFAKAIELNPAAIYNDFMHTPMAHTNLRTTHEWTTPPGETSIAVLGQFAHIFGDDGPRVMNPQIVSWPGVQAQVAGPIKNARTAVERFRARWENYLNDIERGDFAQKLDEWTPEYNWSCLNSFVDGSHHASWDEVRVSSELRDLAYDGHVLYESFFPRNTPIRSWLDELIPGHRLNISWLPTSGAGFVPHVPWGLMYLPDLPALDDAVDPMGFLALRFRVNYTAHEVKVSSKVLGRPEESYRGHFLYWGGQQNDITGSEAQWQREQWKSWQNQVFIPVSGTSSNSKMELLSCLDNPCPSPMTVLYFFCQCAVGDGNDPVLRFGSTSQTADVIRRTDLGTRNFPDQPFVFANACTTSAGDPYIANELEEGFFRRGSRAFLGTESKVPIQFASRFASAFFHFFYCKLPHLANDPQPISAGEAFSQTRLFLWTRYFNIGGLFYTYVNQYELFLARDSDVLALRQQ